MISACAGLFHACVILREGNAADQVLEIAAAKDPPIPAIGYALRRRRDVADDRGDPAGGGLGNNKTECLIPHAWEHEAACAVDLRADAVRWQPASHACASCLHRLAQRALADKDYRERHRSEEHTSEL